MNVSVMREKTRSRVVSTAEIQRAAEAMLRTLKLPKAELSVVLCDDATIHALNRDYRRKDKPTDVLAFALREGPGGHLAGDLLGDVIISLDTATRQAKERAIVTRDEVRMLLAHGLLHLLGWDHRNDAEDKRMRAETDRLLAALSRAEKRATKPTAKPTAKRATKPTTKPATKPTTKPATSDKPADVRTPGPKPTTSDKPAAVRTPGPKPTKKPAAKPAAKSTKKSAAKKSRSTRATA